MTRSFRRPARASRGSVHFASALPLLAALVVACSSTPTGISVPVLSDLSLPPSVAAGSTELVSFTVSNSAGVGSLTVDIQLTKPGASTSTPESTPLTVGGDPSVTQAGGSVEIAIPAGAAIGTYGVSITVSDGVDVSNVLTGTFDVT